MTLSDYELMTIAGGLISVSAVVGFTFCKFLVNKQYNETIHDDTCLTPIGTFGNKPYKMQRVFINGKCKTVKCDFLKEKNKCELSKQKCIYIE